MAEINNQLGRDTNLGDAIGGVSGKPLLRSFMKYFDNTAANILRSVDFGKSLFRYFAPNASVPEDPATLLSATRTLFSFGFSDQDITDETFVRFMIDKVNKEPGLVTFDMVADLVESDAYKNFGKNAHDRNSKQRFERWVYDKSMLSKIGQTPAVDIVLNRDGMERVVKAITPSKKNQDVDYLKQMNAKVNEFDETYTNNVDDNSLTRLKTIARNSKKDFAERLKDVYQVLCDNNTASVIGDVIDTACMATDPKNRNAELLGLGTTTNKYLYAVAARKGWSEKDFQKAFIKFPVEERAEQFEQEAKRRNQQTPLTSDAQAVSQAINEVLQQDDTGATVGDVQPAQTKPAQVTAKFGPAIDVAKTFAGTLVGAAAISTITSIPGVGQIVGPALGVITVATAGIGSAVAAYKAAKKNGEVSKSEAKKIAMQSGLAMLKKSIPYAAAISFGPAGRIVGSGIVFAKTLYNDLERRAGMIDAQLQQERGKGLKGLLNRLSDIANTVSKKDVRKAAGYAFAKGAAVYLGGKFGSMAGGKLGSFAGEKFFNGGKVAAAAIGAQAENLRPADDLQYKQDDLYNHDNYDPQQAKYASSYALPEEIYADPEELYAQSNNGLYGQDWNGGADAGVNVSDENLARLGKIGEVDLTKNARATTHVENHRQYIGGVQQDWYNTAQEQTAIETLRSAGVDDPVGVLRKVGSASRFFGGEYKATLDNLCEGKITDADVDKIFGALDQINREGGLGRVLEQTSQAPKMPQPNYESFTEEIVTEVPPHTQDYRTPGSAIVSEPAPTMEYIEPEPLPVYPERAPIDVPPHTQDYRTPGTNVVEEVTPVVQENVVDIDNTIDYIPTDDFMNTPVPDHTQDYRTPSDDWTISEQPTSTPLPTRTADYSASNIDDALQERLNGAVYGGFDGENDYYTDQQGNEFTVNHNDVMQNLQDVLAETAHEIPVHKSTNWELFEPERTM